MFCNFVSTLHTGTYIYEKVAQKQECTCGVFLVIWHLIKSIQACLALSLKIRTASEIEDCTENLVKYRKLIS